MAEGFLAELFRILGSQTGGVFIKDAMHQHIGGQWVQYILLDPFSIDCIPRVSPGMHATLATEHLLHLWGGFSCVHFVPSRRSFSHQLLKMNLSQLSGDDQDLRSLAARNPPFKEFSATEAPEDDDGGRCRKRLEMADRRDPGSRLEETRQQGT